LKAAIDAAHAHKLIVTGHLCSIGFTEAAELGSDDLGAAFGCKASDAMVRPAAKRCTVWWAVVTGAASGLKPR
jgi:hypothetical protein